MWLPGPPGLPYLVGVACHAAAQVDVDALVTDQVTHGHGERRREHGVVVISLSQTGHCLKWRQVQALGDALVQNWCNLDDLLSADVYMAVRVNEWTYATLKTDEWLASMWSKIWMKNEQLNWLKMIKMNKIMKQWNKNQEWMNEWMNARMDWGDSVTHLHCYIFNVRWGEDTKTKYTQVSFGLFSWWFIITLCSIRIISLHLEKRHKSKRENISA